MRSSPAPAPSSCSSKPGTSRPEPSSTIWSRPSPPANGVPSTLPAKSITTKSPRCGGAVDGLELGGALAQAVDLLGDRLVAGVGLAARDLEPLVVAELGGRADADLDRELQRLALARQGGEVEVGLADRHDAGVVDRRRVPAADRLAHGLVEHRLAADALDHDRRRGLAGAEAGDAQVAARPRAACATRFSTSAAGTSASTRTRDSGSSVTVVVTGAVAMAHLTV